MKDDLENERLFVQNGWYVYRGRVIWGNALHNGWWGPIRITGGWWSSHFTRPNITRNDPGQIGPNRTEDLDMLSDNMLRYGCPGFEHNYGLWYDRRRDTHDEQCRQDANVIGPFLEQPWQRSETPGCWDGLSRYDLEKYNDWYFQRLDEFAALCDAKGTILLHNFYMQHALLECQAHYCDFPWRPVNCIQATDMPDQMPAANAFYDVAHSERRKLHTAYIRKCLDVLGRYSNVMFLVSEEYTGPLQFMQFWLDTIIQWQRDNDNTVHVALGATKDVLDAILADPVRSGYVASIDLRYWWYNADGSLYAPAGGCEIPGRRPKVGSPEQSTPEQIYRQVKEYRLKYPDKGIIHNIAASRQQTWAFLMAGGSLLVQSFRYSTHMPDEYEQPEGCEVTLPAYRFITTHLAETLPQCCPADIVSDSQYNWCLTDSQQTCLIYSLKGGSFKVDLSAAPKSWKARWLNPRTGELSEVVCVTADGTTGCFTAPGEGDWVLWLDGR